MAVCERYAFAVGVFQFEWTIHLSEKPVSMVNLWWHVFFSADSGSGNYQKQLDENAQWIKA